MESVETPLLDQIVAEYDADPVEFAEAHGMTENRAQAFPNVMCRWNPCTFILFGLAGETHEQYHQRKGVY
jgi:hypothetical protein